MEKPPDETRSRGFGFVEMETRDECERAIENLNETKLGHRTIMVEYAGKPASGKPPQQGRGRGRGDTSSTGRGRGQSIGRGRGAPPSSSQGRGRGSTQGSSGYGSSSGYGGYG